MEQEIQFCTAGDGVRIAWSTVGDGPPLVKSANWLNHLEFDWQSPIWRHWFAELCRDHRLIRYDERGNGLSDWDVGELSLEAFVADLENVVDAAGVDRFALLGISQGSAVSVAYAVRHPERVSRLVLYGGYGRGWKGRGSPDDRDRRRAMQTLALQGWGKDNPAYRQLFTSIYVPGASREEMEWFNELQRVSTSPANAVRLMDALGSLDVSSLLPKVTTPTLVLHARDDGVVPYSEGRALAAAIPGARFVSLDSRNHILLGHEPAFGHFLDEVRGFLGVDRRRSTPSGLPRLLRGQRLGRYFVGERIGTGGMGEVYRARDEALSRDVAIKILRAAPTDSGQGARFEREARALASLSHPNIVSIFELGTAQGLLYAVTELLEGQTLRARIEQGPTPAPEAAGLVLQALRALGDAHARGIVHRDLKPENLFLTTRGELKVLDFGLASIQPTAPDPDPTTIETRLTRPGMIVGTSGYMSPEQVRGDAVDARTDIFSLGIVLYEMLTGRHPFLHPNAAETLTAILRDDPPPAPWLGEAIESVVRRCLAKRPEERYATTAELEAALRRATTPRGLRALRAWLGRP